MVDLQLAKNELRCTLEHPGHVIGEESLNALLACVELAEKVKELTDEHKKQYMEWRTFDSSDAFNTIEKKITELKI